MTACCQACGKSLRFGEAVVRVQVGTYRESAHRVADGYRPMVQTALPADFFHATCPIAVREPPASQGGRK